MNPEGIRPKGTRGQEKAHPDRVSQKEKAHPEGVGQKAMADRLAVYQRMGMEIFLRNNLENPARFPFFCT